MLSTTWKMTTYLPMVFALSSLPGLQVLSRQISEILRNFGVRGK